ncbi:ATP-dependent DNA helicase RecG [Pseudothermotoga thermarum]|uniref:ATP-dependent DNA helicase RecG n=1 Tax=Pseudothermotoga thermarum DSM 5069 TaxID=688269 RepID=F7YTD9_9THEM|nr:ATP-dependent DNA helicase RecG [Pseudothermotoga thermarum]AEH50117.1 ATP-dependent DNA helicase RecG [Pseudothermotoga thermarum DSM 5069]
MRPLLVEEFLEEFETVIKKVQNKELSVKDLENFIGSKLNLIHDPLLELEPVAQERFNQMIDYAKPIASLPPERAAVRLKNLLSMVEKYRNWFLINCPVFEETKDPDTPIKYAKQVGPKREKLLAKLEIKTLKDLVWYVPRDYEDRRKIVPIKDIRGDEKVTTLAKIINVETKQTFSMPITVAVAADGINQVLLKWFNQEYMQKVLETLKGKEVYITGVVKRGTFGSLEFTNPEVEPKGDTQVLEILPVYSLTEGLSQKQMRNIVKENITSIKIKETLPEWLIQERKLLDIKTALYGIHFPKSMYHLKKSIERLAYEELLILQLAFLLSKQTIERIGGISKNIKGELAEKFIASLPFKLTNAQIKAHQEIREDMQSEKPMSRLLQGDVGSGKTVVAQLAVIDNFEAGYQAAIMAPTSILAIQHYRRMAPAFEKLGIKTALLLGETSPREKEKIKSFLKTGQIDVIIGTHTLIQEDVEFANLGLVIIDEQHRFGVRQREALISKGKVVDVLVMTATPIPRTLAMTIYGDLDISIIDELPPGRKLPKTILISASKIDQVYDFVKNEVKNGGQAYIVYPLIDESDKVQAKAATQMFEHLAYEVFKDFKVGLLHGRMSQIEKDRIMESFANREIEILVSTTVIEVGIDVPGATVMVIENPERFGLAQLHQLRGRVGRSEKQGYCFLVVGNVDEETLERLRYFAMSKDGFEVAEYDLKLRGPGEFLGLRQHGLPDLRIADLTRDRDLLILARKDAEKLLTKREENKELFERVERLYGERLKLVKV